MGALKWPLYFVWFCLEVVQTKASSWTVNLPAAVKGLSGSCVVIPCSFNYPDPGKGVTTYTGIWYEAASHHVLYHPVESKIFQGYKTRTKLLGDVSQKNCSLKIDPLRQSDQGNFFFRIEMAGYDSYSYKDKRVSISVIGEPHITLSVNQEVVANQTVQASCTMSPSCPTSPPVFTWSHSTVEPPYSPQFVDDQWKTTANLTFHPTHADHNKSLQCTVRYNGQERQASKVLNVKYAPVNVKVEHKSDVKEGEDVLLNCSCDANPSASRYEWHNENGFLLYEGSHFKLPNASRHIGALYCTAHNTIGQGKSSPVQLSVFYAPVNVKVEHKSNVKEGEDVLLKCSSDANPSASRYEWHNENGFLLHEGRRFKLSNVSRHTGAFYCIAHNTIGQGKSSPVQLRVLYAPEIKKVSSCSSEGGVVKCVCIVESRPTCMVHFVLSDRVLPGTKVEEHGSVTNWTLKAEFGSFEVVHCLANNTQGNANLTLSLPVSGKMQNLYIAIIIGAGVVLVILLIVVGLVTKCRGTSGDTPAPHMSEMRTNKAEDLPQYAATERKEMRYQDVQFSSRYDSEAVYGNVETGWDDAIYANV
ncbi:myelin-associated glycoprotein isoform X1 [Lates calcarifer]|uniref:Myelin-associated glycoprotein isoform X1 n=1 Tax=Lates calcarifer TaxID=8187 RepID=A0AAJ7PZP3_LATCA|nr:myelin-associated glycoprotein isoform X1 [Lates calcarifer]XP_018542859.1 myelin-associated glycoprotein isoform X1 [Lates calcarifer]